LGVLLFLQTSLTCDISEGRRVVLAIGREGAQAGAGCEQEQSSSYRHFEQPPAAIGWRAQSWYLWPGAIEDYFRTHAEMTIRQIQLLKLVLRNPWFLAPVLQPTCALSRR
jgi:hypothetical protein